MNTLRIRGFTGRNMVSLMAIAALLAGCGGGTTVGDSTSVGVGATNGILSAGTASSNAVNALDGTAAKTVVGTLASNSGSQAVGSASAVPNASTATTFGPRQYTRTTGAPNAYTETFSRCGGGCQLVVLNGNASGGNRISSATVFVNGRQILGPSDFSKRVTRIVVPVALEDHSEVRVVLNSAPGSYLTISVECALFASLAIEAGPGIGTSTWDNGTVSLAIPLVNEGAVTAADVSITAISAGAGNYQGPTPFTYPVGSIGPEQVRLLDAYFANLSGATTFPLAVRGTYKFGGATCPFQAQVPVTVQPAPGPVAGTAAQAIVQSPRTAFFPPHPAPPTFGPNAESPMLIPVGPARQLFPSTPTGTSLGSSAGGAAVRIPRNTTMRSAGVPPDPNTAATSGGVVLATYNTGISFSIDGGQTFTDVNLFNPQPGNPVRTSFFPASDGGLCCDQIVVYLPQHNLFVWLLQYQPVVNTAVTPNVITTPDRLRVAWATPAALAADFWNAWTYADLTGTNVAGVSGGLGIASNEWLDYPDLAWSDTFLYVGVDQGFPTPGQVYTGRRIVARLSLADMANPVSTSLNYAYARLTGSSGLNKTHFVQGAPGQMVVGSLENSSTLRVFTWRDSENTVNPSTVPISQIQQGASYTSVAPDGSDWVSVSFPGNITGAAFRSVVPGLGVPSRAEYLFAFDAGANAGGGRPRSYVRLETVTPSGTGFQAISEYDIWNADYAFAMAGLAADGTEIGIALGVGGGTLGYPQFSVGFMNDFVVYQVTSSNATQTSRFGDYIAPRFIAGAGLFAVELYDVILNPLPAGTPNGTCATVGCAANMRFVEFGRPFDPGPR
jgi:hypothetical protein